MKLLELQVDKGLDVIADIIGPACEIAEDKNASEIFKNAEVIEGETVLMYWARRIKVALPTLIKNHKDALISIMASVNLMSVEEYKKTRTVVGVVKDIKNLLEDEELTALFTGAGTDEVSE